MFISNNRASFLLWWKKNLVKHQNLLNIMQMIVDYFSMCIKNMASRTRLMIPFQPRSLIKMENLQSRTWKFWRSSETNWNFNSPCTSRIVYWKYELSMIIRTFLFDKIFVVISYIIKLFPILQNVFYISIYRTALSFSVILSWVPKWYR